MRILYVTPYTPNRIRVRPYQVLRELVEQGHAVTLGALWSSETEREELEDLRGLGMRVIAARLTARRSLLNCIQALPTSQPVQASFCWEPELARLLDRAVADEPFDVIQVEHLRGARYGLRLKGKTAATGRPCPVGWDSVDCITHLFGQAAEHSGSLRGRLMTRFELGRTSRFEPWLLGEFDHTLTTSPTDRAALLELAAAAGVADAEQRLSVVPNGVDLGYFSPIDEERLPDTLVLTGKMSYHANVTAAQELVREIMPLVWAQRPDVGVWIVGKDPTREVWALAREAANGRVTVTGTVPDMRLYLRRASIAVAPVPYGAGIQNKVLEAMACGAAVVASRQAVAALQTTDGRDLLVAGDSAEFARQVLSLLEAPERRHALGEAGRRYVERRHAWPRIVGELMHLYESLIQARLDSSVRAVSVFAL